MDELDLAIRRYQQIVPQAQAHLVDRRTLRNLRVWLTDDVCPIAESIARRPAFRERATWAVRAFRPGATTPERKAVDVFDDALVQCARSQVRQFEKKRTQTELARLYPPTRCLVGQAVSVSHSTANRAEPMLGELDELAMEQAQVRAIAMRRWPDLVHVEDFFGPQQEFLEQEDGRALQVGSLVVALNAQLHPAGNFVVRTMFQRIDGLLQILTAVHHKLANAIRSRKTQHRIQSNETEQYDELLRQHERLGNLCQAGPEGQLREACIIMTQVLAAFQPAANLDWLGLPAASGQCGLASLGSRISGYRNGELYERIVAALVQLKQLYVEQPPGQSSLEAAIAAGYLVIDTENCRAYWAGQEIKSDWKHDSKLWQILVALGRKGRLQADVVEDDVYGDAVVAVNAMAGTISRLKDRLPADLRAAIVRGRRARAYRLDVEPHRIAIFPAT